jgi:hypothetical protein
MRILKRNRGLADRAQPIFYQAVNIRRRVAYWSANSASKLFDPLT